MNIISLLFFMELYQTFQCKVILSVYLGGLSLFKQNILNVGIKYTITTLNFRLL